MIKYSAVLNVYKREKNLKNQIERLINQSIAPSEILIWNNGNKKVNISQIKKHYNVPIVYSECDENLGVWARFAFALNAKYDYILLLDDDILPGLKWVENCYTHFEKREGLYGTRGVLFLSENRYTPFSHYGWRNLNEELVEVDIIGHSWFLKREWLTKYWGTAKLQDNLSLAGEDMQLSFAIQSQLGLGSYVPPHPANNPELWGNVPDDKNLCEDENAISLSEGAFMRFDKALQNLRARGFRSVRSRSSELNFPKEPLMNTNIFRKPFLARWIKRHPLQHRILKSVVTFLRKKMRIHL